MPKCSKVVKLARVQDVYRLILAGAEYPEIRQYAAEHGWELSERQVRRYMELAYERLAEAAEQNRGQLLGRHLMQRRALYARSLKGGDLRTALQVLKDEATLQGLYPPQKIAPTTPDGKYPYPGPQGNVPLSRRQRVARLINAEADDDQQTLKLLECATPYLIYRLPDTSMPLLYLYLLAQMYLTEQLDLAGQFLLAIWRAGVEGDDHGQWNEFASVSAYLFREGRIGWTRFTTDIGVDREYLLAQCHGGVLLEMVTVNIDNLAPTEDELREVLREQGREPDEIPTADDLAASWQRMFTEMLPPDRGRHGEDAQGRTQDARTGSEFG